MTFIVEAFFSGCISKVINDGKDYSWTKIKKVINDKNDRNLSTKIYRVIENTLNKVTDKKFKDTDKLYGAIERIFIEFRNNGSTIESVKCGLILLCSDVSDQRCENFLEKFYDGVCQDEDLFKRISLILQEKGIKINQEEFQQLNEKVDNLTDIVSSRNDRKIYLPKKVPVKSRTQEYADKWNANMFLNDFDKRDENAGVNVKLSEVYLEEHLPHYIWGDNDEEEPSTDLKELLSEYINEKRDKKMLLIFGQPGIGKSTLITWIVANFNGRINDILVYKFSSDLINVDWQDSRVSNRILEELGLSFDDLNGKILILDGFDEVSIEPNRRKDILDSLYGDWIYNKTIDNFSLIITCRVNYVQRFAILKCKYITLQPWNEIQIRSFCNIFQEKTKNIVSENTMEKLLNNEILGIPLILYMVLALNISIVEEGSTVDVYDKIFSLEGGIYDRCIDNKMFADKHRIGEIKEQIHQISRDIAIWMFENEAEKACIPQEEYQKICCNIIQEQKKNKEMEQDFLIGNFFKLVKHCEGVGTEELYFVHRSIYEYFVAESIYSSMVETISISKERLACAFGRLLNKGRLSKNILDYLKQKIKKSKLDGMFNVINKTFQLMLQDGMTYYTGVCYKNVMEKEIKVFVNMLEVVHIWEKRYYSYDDSIYNYLKYNRMEHLNLSRTHFKQIDLRMMYLRKADLRGVDLRGAILRGADLRGVDLRGAILRGVDLRGAILRGADLRRVDLRGALVEAYISGDINFDNPDLFGADMKDAIFDETQVNCLHCIYDLQEIKIFISETEDLISYQEYCKRKGWKNR